MMDKNRWRLQILRQKGKTTEAEVDVNSEWMEQDGVRLAAEKIILDGMTLGRLRLEIPNATLQDCAFLGMERPVRVYVPAREAPKRITAMVLFSEWWTRPVFAERISDIPDRTQVVFFDYGDHFGCLIPMVGDRFKTFVHGGTDQELCLEMTAGLGGIRVLEEPLYLYSEAETLEKAVHPAFSWLMAEKGIRPREERRIPEMFRYLGWCSWDAFYTEVSEKNLREKAEELRQKNVPVRWMLIDDGWFTAEEKMLRDFAPDPVKFPHGFRTMIRDIRQESGVRWFGVWHAMGGYWDGVVPGSELAAREADHLYRSPGGRCVPDPQSGSGFYNDWYDLLQREGIDFVKVDGQGAIPHYFENGISLGEASRGIGQAVENGASRMDGAVIHCMGMAMENILARPATAISRNSDDFVPQKEESFVEHLMQNAYNAIYHGEIYCCDWDMFWTKHRYARMHSLLRAISGGPVYFSDRTGDTVPEVIRPLIYPDGRLLMMDRPARPTADCIFLDPRKEGVLKLHNTAPWAGGHRGGGIAAYNLSGKNQTLTFAPTDIPDIEEADRYLVLDYFNEKIFWLEREEVFRTELPAEGYAWYVILPQKTDCLCLGLLGKYVGFTAVESLHEWDGTVTMVLQGSGEIAWVSETKPSRILANGKDVTPMVLCEGTMYRLRLPETASQTVLTILES